MSASSSSKPILGISACLLGNTVRYNGGHKESRLCSRTLSDHFDFVAVCPEVAIGLGTPREPIRLVGDPASPRAVGSVQPDRDVTLPLAEYGGRMAGELGSICGYIFMQKSPSCGLERVKVYQQGGKPSEPAGRGIYAAAFCARHPNLPVEEDGRLNDPVLRENFISRVFAYAAWQQLQVDGISRHRLLSFHARYKYLLLAHNPLQYKALGQLLGSMGRQDVAELAPRYFGALMAALKNCATRGSHSNVLQHLSGHLKQSLSRDEKIEVTQLIEQYRHGIVPLVVPLTLLKHHFRQHPDPYVAGQVYLQPHPENLGLRNAL
ncbi:MAG: DUF523 and DUF1722 domain-containing protein [Pseudomonas sp.]|uniref:YbgA family protein n=1 Tax=Pseudomonas sp. TaxID=306 RepID=UPI003398CE8A